MPKKELPPEVEESDGEFAAVFSDLMSFLAGLFILLFTIVNSQQVIPDYFKEMGLKFGGKQLEQDLKATSEDLFVSDVRNYIQDERLSQYITVLVDEDRIRLILNDPILFKSGTDQMLETSKYILHGLINIIKNVDNSLIIEGHTDDIPVNKNSPFKSNWDLAYFRASTVTQYMISRGISPRRLSITSYGDQRPLAPQKTALARKKNRRIEISLVRVRKNEQ